MTISLIQMRTMAARLAGCTRAIVASMVLSLVLAFAPCCGIFSEAYASSEQAAKPPAPDSDRASHPHETDGNRDICGKWLENATSSPQ